MEASRADLTALLQTLPPAPFAFAYGSGVFPQDTPARTRARARMVDLIVAVDDPAAWHAANMAQNASHYAAPLRLLGARAAARLAGPAGVYFNTLLEGPVAFKYGVIGLPALVRDLTSWDALYVAGRMHKPVAVLSGGARCPPRLRDAAARNIAAAASAALLLLPARFAERELYRAAAALSYGGDVRVAVGAEVGDKAGAIARANARGFRELYANALGEVGVVRGGGGVWERLGGGEGRGKLLERLPAGVVRGVGGALGVKGVASGEVGVREAVGIIARRDGGVVADALRGTLARIVRRSSVRMGVQGLVTAGVGTSVRYVAAKVGKAWAARRR